MSELRRMMSDEVERPLTLAQPPHDTRAIQLDYRAPHDNVVMPWIAHTPKVPNPLPSVNTAPNARIHTSQALSPYISLYYTSDACMVLKCSSGVSARVLGYAQPHRSHLPPARFQMRRDGDFAFRHNQLLRKSLWDHGFPCGRAQRSQILEPAAPNESPSPAGGFGRGRGVYDGM